MVYHSLLIQHKYFE